MNANWIKAYQQSAMASVPGENANTVIVLLLDIHMYVCHTYILPLQVEALNGNLLSSLLLLVITTINFQCDFQDMFRCVNKRRK